MFRNLMCWIVLVIVCTGCVSVRTGDLDVECKQRCKPTAKLLRHVVLFRFKESAGEEKIKEVERAITALPDKIDVIKCLEWGTNVSKEDRSDGFTHCFLLTFSSEQDRDAYLVHPDHKALGQVFGGSLDKVLVVDYWMTCNASGG